MIKEKDEDGKLPLHLACTFEQPIEVIDFWSNNTQTRSRKRIMTEIRFIQVCRNEGLVGLNGIRLFTFLQFSSRYHELELRPKQMKIDA